MLTNPLPLPSSAQSETGPQPLRIAARATHDPHDVQPTAAILISHEVGAWHTQWRDTLQTVKATLAGLEEACHSAIDAREAEVAGLIDALVRGAADETTTAEERIREQAQAEIRELQQASARLQTTVETLQAGLDAERETVKRLASQLDTEGAARVRAEGDRDEFQRQCQEHVATAEALGAEVEAQKAELRVARQQLEAAFAERSKLMTTFRLVQRALALTTPGDTAILAEALESDTTASPDGAQQSTAARAVVPETPAEAPNPVDAARREFIDAHPEAVQDITRVLDQVETVYHRDVESGRPGIEVVDRFTAMLRHARSVIVERWSTENFDAQRLFVYQLDLLLERQAGTSLGRHLGIAAYALRTPAPSPARDEPGPSEACTE